eukprot:3536375-Rhodomonas_salina.1
MERARTQGESERVTLRRLFCARDIESEQKGNTETASQSGLGSGAEACAVLRRGIQVLRCWHGGKMMLFYLDEGSTSVALCSPRPPGLIPTDPDSAAQHTPTRSPSLSAVA